MRLGEDGATYLASCLLDPAAKAQQQEHSDFSAPHCEWDDDGAKGTAARMEQLSVHALLAQLYAPELVQEGEVPPSGSGKGFGGRSGERYEDRVFFTPPWDDGFGDPLFMACQRDQTHVKARTLLPLVGDTATYEVGFNLDLSIQ